MTLSCQRAPHPDAGHWPVAMSSACNGPVAPVRRRWNSIPREPAISATAEYAMAVIAACEAQCPLWPNCRQRMVTDSIRCGGVPAVRVPRPVHIGSALGRFHCATPWLHVPVVIAPGAGLASVRSRPRIRHSEA